jgi:hypothetical protein
MSKQPNSYEMHGPMSNHPRPPSKGEGETSQSGSFHDQADMQRLGKNQELKVRRSYYPVSRSQGNGRIVDNSVDF